MDSIFLSIDLRRLIYDQYCPLVAQLLSISTPFRYNELAPGTPNVAYTILDGSRETQIFINPYHPMFRTIQDPGRQASVYTGVLIHEILHKKYTEPIYPCRLAEKEQIANNDLYHTINNIIEDFTIESRAILDLQIPAETLRLLERSSRFSFSGKMPLAALDSAIITSWSQSPPVTPDEPVIVQVINALIDFTDLGPLPPGSVLSDEAARIYRAVAPMVYDAIWKTPLERAQTALEIYKVLNPFTTSDSSFSAFSHDTRGTNGEADSDAVTGDRRQTVENAEGMKAKARIIAKLRQQASPDPSGGVTPADSDQQDGSGPAPSEKNPEQEEKPSRQTQPSEGGQPDAKESLAETGKPGPAADSGEESGTVGEEEEIPFFSPETDNETAEAADSDKEAEACPVSSESGDTADSAEENGEETDSVLSKDTETDDDTDSDTSDVSQTDSGNTSSAEESPSEKELQALPEEVFSPDIQTLRRIEGCLSTSSAESFDISDLKPGGIGPADFSRTDSQTIDYSLDQDVESKFYKGNAISCRNFRVEGICEATFDQYEKIRKRNEGEISRFSRRMKKLVTESEEKSFEKNGRLNMKRYAEKGGSTINLFSRKTQRNRKDARVLICLDVSGSMCGNKIAKAGEALVCIMEGLATAGIPVKVITFCEKNGFVEHHHFVNYGQSRLDRASLMLIEPGGMNFDGYSIRYAVKDLMKKRVSHDMLIVISDGQPNTSYLRGSDVLSDTAAAVIEAKRQTRVIGIGIDANLDILRGFYKETFVEMTDIEMLMRNLSKLIEKEVKSW